MAVSTSSIITFTALLLCLLVLTGDSSAGVALDVQSMEVSGLAGSYSDPNHPNCARMCTPMNYSTSTFSVYGADAQGGEGVPCDGGKTDTKWGPLPGQYIAESGKLVVDFSSKGGPSDLTGYLNTTSNPPQIQWEDGNIWPKN